MYCLNFSYKNQKKKITLPRNINSQGFKALIAKSFQTKDKIIGFINQKGHILSIEQIQQNHQKQQKSTIFLVTAQDINQDNVSFASDHQQKNKLEKIKKQNRKIKYQTQNQKQTNTDLKIPQKLQGFYRGVIGDLDLFQQLCLQESQVTIVFCFVKEKPKNINYPYYLYHTSRNSSIIYLGTKRVCQFFIDKMQSVPQEIQTFIISLIEQKKRKQQVKQGNFHKQKNQSKRPSNKQSKRSSNKNSFCNKQQAFLNMQKVFSNIQKNQQNKSLRQQGLFNEDVKINSGEDEDDLQNQMYSKKINRNKPNYDEELEKSFQFQNLQQPVYSAQNQTQIQDKQNQLKSSLLENLLKLKDEQQITQLQFYKMKSELLQNLSDFTRRYQMGTRKGRRTNKNTHEQNNDNQSDINAINIYKSTNQNVSKKQQRMSQQQKKNNFIEQRQNKTNKNLMNKKTLQNRQYQNGQRRTPQSRNENQNNEKNSRQLRRVKKYEIPIIVRKYNNVIQKISTSYPLTQQQEQSINLILQLQLKGLISEKESGIYKSSILQQDVQVVPLFLDYFDGLSDQIELVSKLKKIKKVNSEKKQRSEHNMRLLIKYSKQNHYEIHRNLLLENNQHIIGALQKFRQDKNVEKLSYILQKIAQFYKNKKQLQQNIALQF